MMQIVTSEGEKIRDDLLKSIYRGITISEGSGAYTNEKKCFNDSRNKVRDAADQKDSSQS